jgi:hypothetical protein
MAYCHIATSSAAIPSHWMSLCFASHPMRAGRNIFPAGAYSRQLVRTDVPPGNWMQNYVGPQYLAALWDYYSKRIT